MEIPFKSKRISNIISSKFEHLIDMSDWDHRPDAEKRAAFLSRGLAALALNLLTDATPQMCANAITDGGDDFQIDALHYESASATLFFINSKWSDKGNKTVDTGSVSKFIDGISKIINVDFSGMNEKLTRKADEVRALMFSNNPLSLRFIIIHNGVDDVSAHIKTLMENYTTKINGGDDFVKVNYLGQSHVYGLVTEQRPDQNINITISLRQYGELGRPYRALYGRANIIDIADWWSQYKNSIFTRNLRQFIPRSDINDAIGNTVVTSPTHFWYLNNGITIICQTAVRRMVHADNREIGIFDCKGVSVVNGAQTVGSIGRSIHGEDPDASAERFKDAWVNVRIIPMDGCPPEFDRMITEATNFQNTVIRRDFAALDANQHRIAIEFAHYGRRYAYRSGDEQPREDEGCSITDAAQALACATSMDMAVQVKREIGAIWNDTSQEPYTLLFNQETDANRVWKAVSIMRGTETILSTFRGSTDMNASIATHLNRAILSIVFSDSRLGAWVDQDIASNQFADKLSIVVYDVFSKVCQYIESNHNGEYMQSFSKNRDKCVAMGVAITGRGHARDLFSAAGM